MKKISYGWLTLNLKRWDTVTSAACIFAGINIHYRHSSALNLFFPARKLNNSLK